jgi:ATP-dependent DNA ligase
VTLIKPMLAETLPDDRIVQAEHYAAEQKYDGHRILIEVAKSGVVGLSPLGNIRSLPDHIEMEMRQFPVGVYDGALIRPDGVFKNVVNTDRDNELAYVMFDVLRLLARDTTQESYTRRRGHLTEMFANLRVDATAVVLSEGYLCNSLHSIRAALKKVWKCGGDGLILKRRSGKYYPGKRSDVFLKVKPIAFWPNCPTCGRVLRSVDANWPLALALKNDRPADAMFFACECAVHGPFHFGAKIDVATGPPPNRNR